MANEQNLIPLNKKNKEERKKIGAMGGIASGEAKRKRKTLKEELKLALSLQDEKTKETNQYAMTLSLVKEAKKGNIRAYEIARDTIGEEKEEQEHYKVSIPAKLIAKSFVDVNLDIDDREHLEYWFLGGRGSTKSTYWGNKVMELLNNNTNMCALFVRKVSNTLKDSVFSQMKYSDEVFREEYPFINNEWKFTKSPMESVNQNGQVMYFRGCDDPTKIKSIRPPKDKYIGIVVYEEFDQMAGMNEIRTINQSITRGGEDFVQFYCCNTPKSLMHFVNKEAKVPKANRLIHRSDYRDVPVKWLGKVFIEEAEYLKEVNPTAYEHEYLGIATGIGGVVFENVELRKITDEEIEQFDYVYQGLDFGWFPDITAYTKMYYNSNKRELYIYDELGVNKTSISDLWKILQEEKGINPNDMIIGDSAEPRSIADLKSYGANIRGAEKGPGSVDYGIKWLQSLNKIIIDNERCPISAKEFTDYEYMKDKDGNDISQYPDKDNHMIDSCRYGMSVIWKRRGE